MDFTATKDDATGRSVSSFEAVQRGDDCRVDHGRCLWAWHRVGQDRLAMLNEKAKEQEETRVNGLVRSLMSAEPARIPKIVNELGKTPELAARHLSSHLSSHLRSEAETADKKREHLHAMLAMVGRDKTLVKPLLEKLLRTPRVAYIGPIRQLLKR